MERDHHQAPGRREPAGGARQEPVEVFELAIDPDANRLKRPRRRIDARIPLRGTAFRTMSASRPVVSIRRVRPASTIARATRRAWRSSPNS